MSTGNRQRAHGKQNQIDVSTIKRQAECLRAYVTIKTRLLQQRATALSSTESADTHTTNQMKRQQIVFFKNFPRTKLKWNGTEGLLCKRDPDCRPRIFNHHRTPRERRCTHDSPATTEQRTHRGSPSFPRITQHRTPTTTKKSQEALLRGRATEDT